MAGKIRWMGSEGLLGQQSSWYLGPGIADFGNAVVAATTGVNAVVALALPDTTNLGVVGANDPYPAPLAAATATRSAGASSAPAAVLARAWIYSANAAGTGVFAPAATASLTLNIISGSSSATTGIVTTVVSAQSITAVTTQWTLCTFAAAPAERVATLTGNVNATNPYLLFWGDTVVAQIANTNAAALTVASNKLAVVLEYA